MKWFLTVGLALVAAASDASILDMRRVSVVAASQSPDFSRYEKTVRSAFESILEDNGIDVLDADKSEALRSGWDSLNDPGSLITAEDFIERAQQYAIDGVVTLYFDVEVSEVLPGYFSATATVTPRLVSSEADVKTTVGTVMGTLGYTPSDGLTASAAMVNALRREVDRNAAELRLDVLAPERPFFLDIAMKPSAIPAGAMALGGQGRVPGQYESPALNYTKGRGQKRSISCSVRATDEVGILGVYTKDIDLQRGRRAYGSSIALVDIENGEIANELTFNQVNEDAARTGRGELTGCAFFNGWRFFVGASGRGYQVIDMEKGRATITKPLPFKADEPRVSVLRAGEKVFVKIQGDRARDMAAFELVADR